MLQYSAFLVGSSPAEIVVFVLTLRSTTSENKLNPISFHFSAIRIAKHRSSLFNVQYSNI